MCYDRRAISDLSMTDLVSLKSSGAKKMGGMFGRVTGVEGIDKTEAHVDFKLFAVGESSP